MVNKKAQSFTLIAIALIILMFASFEIYSMISQRQEVNTRISTMETFLNSIEKNLERQVYISGFRTIFLAENEITEKGVYINNFTELLNEAFFNGTINQEPSEILVGVTYNDIVDSIEEKSSKINVNITFSNPKIEVSQEDPWHVKVTLSANFIMNDKSNLAKWEKYQVVSAYIPIETFEDPIYTINTNALISKKINETIYTGYYTDGSDVTNLQNHLYQGYYAANPSAPSFLKRLEGNFSADENGIESLVNLAELSQQGLPVSTKSCVDYIYFSGDNPSFASISGMPSWFYLDTNHLAFYNATHLT